MKATRPKFGTNLNTILSFRALMAATSPKFREIVNRHFSVFRCSSQYWVQFNISRCFVYVRGINNANLAHDDFYQVATFCCRPLSLTKVPRSAALSSTPKFRRNSSLNWVGSRDTASNPDFSFARCNQAAVAASNVHSSCAGKAEGEHNSYVAQQLCFRRQGQRDVVVR